MTELLGVRADLAIAAAFGAAFLVLYRDLTPRQAMGSVAGGVGTALYFTPVVVPWIAHNAVWFPSSVIGERAVALLWGLGGTFFLAGLVVLAERWKKDPVNTVKDLRP
ncbi:MAG: hypothetical protein Q8K85_03355 [Hyphomicrobium sp.]|nr:hypothetical protein [Hyphomicrobium sp.]